MALPSAGSMPLQPLSGNEAFGDFLSLHVHPMTVESRLALVVVPLPWLCLCLFRRHSSSEGVLLGASGGGPSLCALCAWNP